MEIREGWEEMTREFTQKKKRLKSSQISEKMHLQF